MEGGETFGEQLRDLTAPSRQFPGAGCWLVVVLLRAMSEQERSPQCEYSAGGRMMPVGENEIVELEAPKRSTLVVHWLMLFVSLLLLAGSVIVLGLTVVTMYDYPGEADGPVVLWIAFTASTSAASLPVFAIGDLLEYKPAPRPAWARPQPTERGTAVGCWAGTLLLLAAALLLMTTGGYI